MAKDDYDYIVFKILTYLYACLKRKTSFDETVLKEAIITRDVSEEYFTDVLRMMKGDDLVDGIAFIRAFGTTYILITDLSDLCITSKGISYVLDNDKMKQIKKKILESTPGLILELVKLVF